MKNYNLANCTWNLPNNACRLQSNRKYFIFLFYRIYISLPFFFWFSVLCDCGFLAIFFRILLVSCYRFDSMWPGRVLFPDCFGCQHQNTTILWYKIRWCYRYFGVDMPRQIAYLTKREREINTGELSCFDYEPTRTKWNTYISTVEQLI